MPDEDKKELWKMVGSKFYIWFLTFCIVAIIIFWLYKMEIGGVIWTKVTGGIAVLPLVGVLRNLIKSKREEYQEEFKLARQKENHAFKLEKLKLKIELKKI